jgi:lysophospholipase L1-like esterase
MRMSRRATTFGTVGLSLWVLLWIGATSGVRSQGVAAPTFEPWVAAWGIPVVGPTPPRSDTGSGTGPGRAGSAGPRGTSSAGGPGTYRYRVRVGLSGDQVRVRLSNELGTTAFDLGAASIGRAAKGGGVQPESVMTLTFSGAPSATAAVNAPLVSDPVPFRVNVGDELTVSVFAPRGLPTTNSGAAPGSVEIVADTDATGEGSAQAGTVVRASYLVTEIDVRSTAGAKAVAALGDSITQGPAQTALNGWEPKGWPDHLAVRLTAAKLPVSVVNVGINGNRLLTDGAGVSALSRLDRDVLSRPGVGYLIVAMGINDIGLTGVSFPGGPSAITRSDQVTFAYRQIIERAHAREIRVIGATVTPFQGAFYDSAEKEAIRQDVNRWIRTSGRFDGVIDFDAVLRDPTNPARLSPDYDSGDHLHPGPLGYTRMGQAIDLRLFGN